MAQGRDCSECSLKNTAAPAQIDRAYRYAWRVVFPLTVSSYASPSAYSVRRINMKLALRPYDSIGRHIRSVETGHKRSDASSFEPQKRGGRFINLVELRCAAVDRNRHDLRGFRSEQIPSSVDAIDAYVVQRSASHALLRPDVTPAHRHREGGIEELRDPNPSAPNQVDRLQVDLFEM